MHVFFFEVPPFEELQDPGRQRAHVKQVQKLASEAAAIVADHVVPSGSGNSTSRPSST